MENPSYIAMSLMTGLHRQMDVLANNMANSGTSGFKADREFYSLFRQELPVIETRWTDFSQGTVMPTGNPLDLALDGKGFFALNSPAPLRNERDLQNKFSHGTAGG